MEKLTSKLKVRKANVAGFNLKWQSKKNSSMRTVAISNLMKSVRTDDDTLKSAHG